MRGWWGRESGGSEGRESGGVGGVREGEWKEVIG